MPRGNLSPPTFLPVLSDSCPATGAIRESLRPKPSETGAVDGVERQKLLKPLFGGGVDLTGRPHGSAAVELGPIALEAQRATRSIRG